MKLVKNIAILSFMLGLSILPSFAKIDGLVSKSHFFDTEKTIMTEVKLEKGMRTDKFWDKNVFYFNKYRPIFMLSNKELYDLIPKEEINVVQRFTAPTVYNISLKNSSVKVISLSEKVQPVKVVHKQAPVVVAKAQTKKNLSLYEQAMSPDADSDKKVSVALALKNSKNPANYKLALDLLDNVTKEEPYNAYAFYLKGEIYAQRNEFSNAMENYVKSLKINPTNKQCCLSIARILKSRNRELAQKYYDRALFLSENK